MSFIKSFNEFLNESQENEINSIHWSYNDIWKGSLYDDGLYKSYDIVFSGIPIFRNIEEFGAPIPSEKWHHDCKYSIFTIGAAGEKMAVAFLKNGEVFGWIEDDRTWKNIGTWNTLNLLSIIDFIKERETDEEDFDYSELENVFNKIISHKSDLEKNNKKFTITAEKITDPFYKDKQNTFSIKVSDDKMINGVNYYNKKIMKFFPEAIIMFSGKDEAATSEGNSIYTGYIVKIPNTSIHDIENKIETDTNVVTVEKIENIEPKYLYYDYLSYGLK